jgi:hypothetical protein
MPRSPLWSGPLIPAMTALPATHREGFVRMQTRAAIALAAQAKARPENRATIAVRRAATDEARREAQLGSRSAKSNATGGDCAHPRSLLARKSAR